MQGLKFESSWDRTIAAKDRSQIEDVFVQTAAAKTMPLQLVPLWQAVNHKGQLLVTVLIHNYTEQSVAFHDTPLYYLENNSVMANHLFTLPDFIIDPQTSMPWTFIFPSESIKHGALLENGSLEIDYGKDHAK